VALDDRSRSAGRNEISLLRKGMEVLAGAITLVLVFAAVQFLLGKAITARFPMPSQAAVWSTMAMFVAASVAVAAAVQVWWLIRQSR